VQWAAAAGNVETCRWLLAKGIDLSHVNAARHGAVVKAAWKGHMPALQWLLEAPDGPHLTSRARVADERESDALAAFSCALKQLRRPARVPQS
jgi:hypothetical protein